jgi:sporulation protein YlmC with PRC-barrel domain
MTPQSNATISLLSDSGETVARPSDDLRGRHVKDADGTNLGKVHDLLIDDQERRVRFLLVEHGGVMGLGAKRSLVPVDAITAIADDTVSISHTGEHVADAPEYDPALVDDRSYHELVYDHYGYTPYWGVGYTYPPAYLDRRLW